MIAILDSLRWHARALASFETARIVHFTGTLRGNGLHVSALYAGNGANLDFVTKALFETIISQQQLGESPPSWLAKALARSRASADVVIMERPPLWATLGGSQFSIRMPSWIRQELQLPGADSEQWMLGRHLEREVGRQIRRRDYRLAMSTASDDKQEFFDDFYQPYVRSRHGSGAITVDRQQFARLAAYATLAKLYAGDSWTAGMLLQQNAGTLRLGWFGSKQNPPASGASEVLDALCIKAAAANGVRRIHFGNSRPSLIDGVVRYKRRFGARAMLPRYPQTIIELQLTSTQRPLREWLTSQQFLCIHRGALAVARYPSALQTSQIEFDPINTPPDD